MNEYMLTYHTHTHIRFGWKWEERKKTIFTSLVSMLHESVHDLVSESYYSTCVYTIRTQIHSSLKTYLISDDGAMQFFDSTVVLSSHDFVGFFFCFTLLYHYYHYYYFCISLCECECECFFSFLFQTVVVFYIGLVTNAWHIIERAAATVHASCNKHVNGRTPNISNQQLLLFNFIIRCSLYPYAFEKKKKKENVLFWCLQIFARWHPHEPKPKVMSLCVYFVLPSISYARLSLITNIRKMHWPLWRQMEFRFVCCLVHTYIFSQVVSCYSFWSQSVQ